MEYKRNSACVGYKAIFHKDNQTIVEWHFKNKMNEEKVEEFDGISLIVWTADNK